MPDLRASAPVESCNVVVIWIDWYPYHLARFEGLRSNALLSGSTVGIELVGGVGVHKGLKFREELPAGVPIETLMPQASWRDANHLKLAAMLWHKLSRLDPEVVLVPGYYTLPAIAAALWARLHGAASVLMTESCAFDHERTGWKERAKSWGMRLLFNWAVAGGTEHVRYLEQLHFPLERVVGSYDVVDNEMFGQGTAALREVAGNARAEAGLPDSPYFLYVGRLAEEKNVATLLRAWIDYRQAGGTWPLVLVGDGPEAGSLRTAAAASAFAADVLFPGLKTSRELLPFYAFAGCFVLPSTREPWGLVVNEAMASGLPVLVSDRCGCGADLVKPGENGYRFRADDRTALQGHLAHIAALPDEQRHRMGEASRSIIDGFSPARFGHSIASIARATYKRTPLQPLAGETQ